MDVQGKMQWMPTASQFSASPALTTQDYQQREFKYNEDPQVMKGVNNPHTKLHIMEVHGKMPWPATTSPEFTVGHIKDSHQHEFFQKDSSDMKKGINDSNSKALDAQGKMQWLPASQSEFPVTSTLKENDSHDMSEGTNESNSEQPRCARVDAQENIELIADSSTEFTVFSSKEELKQTCPTNTGEEASDSDDKIDIVEFFVGSEFKMRTYYIYRDHAYRINSKRGEIGYVVCCNYKRKGCRASGKMTFVAGVPSKFESHSMNHKEGANCGTTGDEMRIKERCLHRAATEPTGPKKIVDQEMLRFKNCGIAAKNIMRMMETRRRVSIICPAKEFESKMGQNQGMSGGMYYGQADTGGVGIGASYGKREPSLEDHYYGSAELDRMKKFRKILEEEIAFHKDQVRIHQRAVRRQQQNLKNLMTNSL